MKPSTLVEVRNDISATLSNNQLEIQQAGRDKLELLKENVDKVLAAISTDEIPSTQPKS
jgi:hypothetical protein